MKEVTPVTAVTMFPFQPTPETKRFVACWFQAGYRPRREQLESLCKHISSKQDQRFLHGTLHVFRGDGGLLLALELSQSALPDAEPIAIALNAVIAQHFGVAPSIQRGKQTEITRLVPKRK